MGASGVLAQEAFTHSVPIGKATAELTVDFHDESETMVTCTPEQVEKIGARGVERLTTLLPALNARVLSRHDPDGTVVRVLLDAACYEGGIMGMGGYGRGEEKIALAYEEARIEGEWGPPIEEPAPAQ